VKPPSGLATADVYRAWDNSSTNADKPVSANRNSNRLDQLVTALRRGESSPIGRLMTNDLQAAAASLSPWIERIERTFAKLNFVGHQLTGSGTAYFGICRHAQHARRLATILRTLQLGLVYSGRTCR